MEAPHFAKEHAAYCKAKLKGLRIRIAILAVLQLVIIAYLGWLSMVLAELDAPALADLGGQLVRDHLPPREELADEMVARAPELLDLAEAQVLEVPAHLRRAGLEHLDALVEDHTAAYRTTITTMLDEVIEEGLANLEEVEPGESTDTQIERVLDATMVQLEERWGDFFAETGKAYKGDIAAFNADLRTLMAGEDLTRKQELERKLIQSTLALNEWSRVDR